MLPFSTILNFSSIKFLVLFYWIVFLHDAVRSETMFGLVNYEDNCDETPRMCYSCASNNVAKDWKLYKDYFQVPKNFTHSCEITVNNKHVPVVECFGACITIVEQVYIFGSYVGENYFRGCMEKTFKSRLVEDNAKRVLMQTNEQCKSVPRNVLFSRPRLRSDNLKLCFCACDRCNGQLNSCRRHFHDCSNFVYSIVSATLSIMIYFVM